MTSVHYLLVLPALALVVSLALLAGRAARRYGLAPRGGGGGRLEPVQCVALDARRRVHLLRCDGRHLLVMTGGGADVMLGWVDDVSATPGGAS